MSRTEAKQGGRRWGARVWSGTVEMIRNEAGERAENKLKLLLEVRPREGEEISAEQTEEEDQNRKGWN